MKKISVHLTVEELGIIVKLADNQLFRMKFIDTKLPGHYDNAAELKAAQAAVAVLRECNPESKVFKVATQNSQVA
jgi:hypothetical protein